MSEAGPLTAVQTRLMLALWSAHLWRDEYVADTKLIAFMPVFALPEIAWPDHWVGDRAVPLRTIELLALHDMRLIAFEAGPDLVVALTPSGRARAAWLHEVDDDIDDELVTLTGRAQDTDHPLFGPIGEEVLVLILARYQRAGFPEFGLPVPVPVRGLRLPGRSGWQVRRALHGLRDLGLLFEPTEGRVSLTWGGLHLAIALHHMPSRAESTP